MAAPRIPVGTRLGQFIANIAVVDAAIIVVSLWAATQLKVLWGPWAEVGPRVSGLVVFFGPAIACLWFATLFLRGAHHLR